MSVVDRNDGIRRQVNDALVPVQRFSERALNRLGLASAPCAPKRYTDRCDGNRCRTYQQMLEIFTHADGTGGR
jgi:hypothetical protein